MGAQGSKDVLSSMASFASEEQEKIEALFRGLVLNEGDKFSEKKLQGHLRHYFNQEFISKLYSSMASFDSEGGETSLGLFVTKNLFYQSLAAMLKGTLEQRARLVRSLAGALYEKTITAKDLVKFVETIVKAYFIAIEELPEVKSWPLASITDAEISSLALYIVEAVITQDDLLRLGKDQKRIEEIELMDWLGNNTFFQHMLEYVNQTCFDVLLTAQKPTVPRCGSDEILEEGTLLNLPMLILLNQALPVRHRNEWRLLFDSRLHGESSTNLMRLIKSKGPSVLIVEDSNGHVFGGFASESWQTSPGFRGSNECFLFSLRPTTGIYRPSGINDNFMYMESGQETVPNGVGMGGQLRYFGLWIDAEYGRGHSKAKPRCTTFESPQLSKDEEFTFTRMEVWAVGEEIRLPTVTVHDFGDTSLEIVRHNSVLDADPGARALLSLIGKGTTSDDLRERSGSTSGDSTRRSRTSSNAGSGDDVGPRSPSRSFSGEQPYQRSPSRITSNEGSDKA